MFNMLQDPIWLAPQNVAIPSICIQTVGLCGFATV